jgi:hypothetical protein
MTWDLVVHRDSFTFTCTWGILEYSNIKISLITGIFFHPCSADHSLCSVTTIDAGFWATKRSGQSLYRCPALPGSEMKPWSALDISTQLQSLDFTKFVTCSAFISEIRVSGNPVQQFILYLAIECSRIRGQNMVFTLELRYLQKCDS